MEDIIRKHTTAKRSSAVIYNGMVFIGGQTAEDRSQGIAGQTREVLAKIDKLLAEAGTDKSRLLSSQIWIKDIKHDFAAMTEVWEAWTAPNASPTRATVQCALGLPEILIEVIVTAATGRTAEPAA